MIFKAIVILASSTVVLGFPSIISDIGSTFLGTSSSSDSSSSSPGIGGAIINTAINAGSSLASKGLEVAGGVASSGIDSAIQAGSDAVNSGIATAINAGTDLASMGIEAAGAVGGRFQGAFNDTYQEEKNSVGSSFNSVQNLIHQNIATGANLAKTAFDLGTIVPKFGKNLILG